MSRELINGFSDATAGLRMAMQAADLSAIEKAMAHFRTSVDAVQSVGAWRADPELQTLVKTILEELESSRMMACLLGDMSGQMHMALAARNPDAQQPLYQRAR